MRTGSTQRHWMAALIVGLMMMLHLTHVHAADGDADKANIEQADDNPADAADHDDDEDDDDDDDDDWDEYDKDDPMANYLGRNLRLVFEMRPLEANDKAWSIVAATSDYTLKVNVRHGDQAYHVAITGSLTPVWSDDDDDDDEAPSKYLVIYHCDLAFGGDGNTIDVEASGSRVIDLDEAKLLAELGDKTLYLKLLDADDE